MEKRRVVAGIDIGTYHVKVVIAQLAPSGDKNVPMILGRGTSESKGLRYGYIVNTEDATRSIAQAVKRAEKAANVSISSAFVSIGGIELSSTTTNGSVVITRADSQITDLDVEKVHEACEQAIPPQDAQNRKIIHAIPVAYKVDGRPIFGDPLKMKGMRFEARMLFITCLEQHLTDLVQAVENAGIDVIDVTAAPLAAGYVTLSRQQRTAGCVLANIGSETVSIVVYENNIPISLEIFPIGSTDITNDLALGLKIPLEEAEQIKHGALSASSVPKRKIDEIVKARLSDMFDLIEAHLKKIGRNGLLPAGIIITGGGSGIGTIEDLARSALDLPSKRATLPTNSKDKSGNVVKDSSWSVAYGLCVFGLHSDGKGPLVLTNIFKVLMRTINQGLQKILP